MNEEQQNILKNFQNLDEDLQESEFKEQFSILREAWAVETSKPGCTQCIKNAAMAKYSNIASTMVMHNLSIEDAKKVHDLRTELGKEHQVIQQKINKQVEDEIQAIKKANDEQ